MITKITTQQGASSWNQRVNLDGSAFLLDFNWNGRGGAWFISLSDAEGVPLVMSRKVVTDRPLFGRFKFQEGMPKGEVYALDPSGQIAYAGYTELGTAVELFYFDAAELAGL